jgi:tRNA(fMet)-specific endonuclease VapC
LLDTNIVIAILNQDNAVETKLADKTVFLASIVLGELYYGARKSGRIDANIQKVDQFAADYPILNCTKQTAEHYGDLKRWLESKGRPIPENDIWIAALALERDLTLVTRDDHFRLIDNLRTERW